MDLSWSSASGPGRTYAVALQERDRLLPRRLGLVLLVVVDVRILGCFKTRTRTVIEAPRPASRGTAQTRVTSQSLTRCLSSHDGVIKTNDVRRQ